MKVTIPTTKEIDVKYVMVTVPVRYEEEDMPHNFFGRHGDIWSVLIDVDTGVIQGYTGAELDLSMKVVDQGIYELLDADHQSLAIIDQDYVPHGLIPGRWGDYIDMEIDATGKIANWKSQPNFEDFFK